MKKISISVFIFILLLCVSFQIAQAEVETDERKVASVSVEGNQSISSTTILSRLKTTEGGVFSQRILNEDLKRLYGMGYFSDVSIDVTDAADGVAVKFIVVEKSIIKAINFVGVKRFNISKLKAIIKSSEEGVVDERQLLDDANAITRFYKEKGYLEVTTTYKIIPDDKNAGSVVNFYVDEGGVVRIKKISIEGNANYKDKVIRKLMKSKPDTLLTSGFFKEELLDEDIRRIESFYKDAGFVDIQVDKKLDYPENDELNLIVIITEGRKYQVGEVRFKGNDKFAISEITDRLALKSGTTFSERASRADLSAIQSFYFEKGYIFATIKSDVALNPNTKRIDISYAITENDLAYVNLVKVKGNTKTKDIVIRRELRINPGEPFDGEAIRRSKERLYNLGFFEEVSFETEPSTVPQRKDLVVEVKEAKTGEFSFGAGYSTIDEFVGFVEVAQKNFDIQNFPEFTGDGQELLFRASFGTIREDYQLSFTEPWIFDYPLLFGFDLYQTSRERESDVGYSYDEKRRGLGLRLAKEFNDYLKGNMRYRLDNVNISDVDPGASLDLRSEEGENQISSVTVGLVKDTRNSIFVPSRGYVLSTSMETAGGPFGGDKDFVKYEAGASYYKSVFNNNVIELKARGGIVDAYSSSDRVPIYERFYAGGANTIRGYKERRVGPRDASSDDPIGGESMLIGNVEYTFPVIEVIKGAFFVDAGQVWQKAGDLGSGSFKYGAGVGVRVKTPLGPMKVDYGYPLNPDDTEPDSGRIHFTMTRGF